MSKGKKSAPSKTEIALLPPFIGLTLEHIHVPHTQAEFAAASADIFAAGIVGFDTESKPTFVTGEVSEGPHVVQFSLHDKAYLFQLHHPASLPFLMDLLRSEQLLKVGFGLKSDSGHIFKKLGIRFGGVVDLNSVFRKQGYNKEIGVRAAVALMFNQRFAKSKKVTTTNWSQPELTAQQILYAANDAYAALKVFKALNLPRKNLPIMGANVDTDAAETTQAD